MDSADVPATMRRVMVGKDSVEVVPAATPVPGPDEALVRTVVAGVCGSDTHAMHGLHPFITLPYAPGHEVCGVVVGGSVLPAGTRVTVEPDLPCWSCKQCRAGRENICENLRFFGCAHDQGGMADYFTIDRRRLHVVPDDLDWPTAALIEPLSTPVHATGLAGDVRDRTVAILGAGTIGLLLLKLARANQATMLQAVALANKGGTVVVVGVPAGEVSVPLHTLQDSQIRIQGSATYLPEDYTDAIGLLRDGVVTPAEFVTSIRPLEDTADAFRDADSGTHIKVLITTDGSLV